MSGNGDHPEFPQERPAVQYIVEQASKIDDTQHCTIGYYENQNKVLSTLQRTNDELSRLHLMLDGLDSKEIQKPTEPFWNEQP